MSAFSDSPYKNKVAVHWYLPSLSLAQAKTLALYDLAIVDPECVLNSRSSLDYLRKNHPGLKILSYFNYVEWFDPMFPDKPWNIKILAELKKHPEWWLTGTNGLRLGMWPGMYTLNCCWDSPPVGPDGQNYIQFVTSRYIADILSTYRFDGVLVDNLWTSVDWEGGKQTPPTEIDHNHKGRPDNPQRLNEAWRQGMNYCLRELRRFGGKNFLIIGNPGDVYYRPWLDGVMLENFPEQVSRRIRPE